MKEIIEKLNTIKNQIILENPKGKLLFFALIERADIDGKWDILLSTDWYKKNNSEEDLIYVIEKIKKEFNQNLSFLTRVVLLTTSETFIRLIKNAIVKENKINEQEILSLKTSTDFTIKHLFIIHFDLAGIDFNNRNIPEETEPIASREIEKF